MSRVGSIREAENSRGGNARKPKCTLPCTEGGPRLSKGRAAGEWRGQAHALGSVSISGSWPEGLKRRKAASAALGFLRKVRRLAQTGSP